MPMEKWATNSVAISVNQARGIVVFLKPQCLALAPHAQRPVQFRDWIGKRMAERICG